MKNKNFFPCTETGAAILGGLLNLVASCKHLNDHCYLNLILKLRIFSLILKDYKKNILKYACGFVSMQLSRYLPLAYVPFTLV